MASGTVNAVAGLSTVGTTVSPSCVTCCVSSGTDEAAPYQGPVGALTGERRHESGGHLVAGDRMLGDQPVEDRHDRFLPSQRGLVVGRRDQQILRFDRRADQPPDLVLLADQRRRQGLQTTDIVVGAVERKADRQNGETTRDSTPRPRRWPRPTRTARAGWRGATAGAMVQRCKTIEQGKPQDNRREGAEQADDGEGGDLLEAGERRERQRRIAHQGGGEPSVMLGSTYARRCGPVTAAAPNAIVE